MTNVLLLRYHEIALKGGNRKLFEEQLVSNVKHALEALKITHVSRIHGGILVKLPEGYDEKQVFEAVSRVFGVANFCFAVEFERSYEALEGYVIEALKDRDYTSFGIRARRSDKDFEMTSKDIGIKLGQKIVDTYSKDVNLDDPDLPVYVDVIGKSIYVYFQKIDGPGGLPVGTSAPMVSLLSGGIDSPVAAWMMAKRGAESVFVHFHSYPQTNKESIENVTDLATVLNRWGVGTKLYHVPFLDIQKAIIDSKADPKYRVILYRRAMRTIAESIAKLEKGKALITGESLGQVASQTIENITVVGSGGTVPILRPLIGMDKDEIIDAAQEIGTFDISIRPQDDTCSFFVPDHPETKARLRDIQDAEKLIDFGTLLEEAVGNAEVIHTKI